MAQSRRNFLQLFGVGATVVPLIGGAPELAAAARLIEVPKVEPAPIKFGLVDLVSETGVPSYGGAVTVYVVSTGVDGSEKKFCFQADSFLTHWGVRHKEIYGYGGYPVDVAVESARMKWTLEGECVTDAAGRLCQIIKC